MYAASPQSLLSELRARLRELFALQERGAGHRLHRAQGYIDGYMCVLLETGIVTRSALLDLVAEERVRAHGPATTRGQSATAVGSQVTASAIEG